MNQPRVSDAMVEAARKAYGAVECMELCHACGGTGRERDNYTACGACEGGMWQPIPGAPDPLRAALEAALAAPAVEDFQARVAPWMQECFGPEISADKLERGDRLLEETLELLQSGDFPKERVAALVEYVWGRPKGEPAQEVGGVMVTLAAYCLAHDLGMHEAGEVELTRILRPEIVAKIRAKQAAKARDIPFSPLPALAAQAPPPVVEAVAWRYRKYDANNVPMGFWNLTHDEAMAKQQAINGCVVRPLFDHPAPAPVVDAWRPIAEIPNTDDLFWFRRGNNIDGPAHYDSAHDPDSYDYFAPCEPPTVALASHKPEADDAR
jgi:hypothetical protein